jgi:hypothetical protein
MTVSITKAQQLQLGRETVAGTKVAGSTLWRGPASKIKDEQTQVMPDENIGITAKVARQFTTALGASYKMPSTELTFEQFPHILEAGVKTVTPSADGVGTDKIYTYPLTWGATPPTTKTYTLRDGDAVEPAYMANSFVEAFSLEGQVNAAWKVSADWRGKQWMSEALTGSLSAPSVEAMMFNLSTFYFDAVSGTLGATQVVNSVKACKIDVKTGLVAQSTGDGALTFSYVDFVGAECSIELTMILNTALAGMKSFWLNNTPRWLQVKGLGSTVATPGTAYSKKTGLFSFPGIFTEWDTSGDMDGVKVVKAKFEAAYDATAATFAEFIVVNELASLP